MAKTDSTQSTVVDAEPTRHSLADIASDIEGANLHLRSMINVSMQVLCDLGTDMTPDQLLDAVGEVQSLLDSARNYHRQIAEANDKLYKQAWSIPNDQEAAHA